MHATLLAVTCAGKSEITRGNVTAGNLFLMENDDLSWTRLDESWERLRWARERKFSTAKQMAEAMGMSDGTYRPYEREPGTSKHTPLNYQKAVAYAAKLGVRWEWLLNRQGKPWIEESPGERAKRLIESQPPERQEGVVAAIEQLLKAGS